MLSDSAGAYTHLTLTLNVVQTHLNLQTSPGSSVALLTGAVSTRLSSHTHSSIETICVYSAHHWRETPPMANDID